MDIETLFLKTMAQAIDDMWMRGGPQPTDDVLIAIEPRLACLLEIDGGEPCNAEDDGQSQNTQDQEHRMSDSTTPQDGKAMSPASACPHGPLFSDRLRLSKQAEEWCDGNRVPHHPLNIVTALFSLGLVVKRPVLTDDERRAIEWYAGYGKDGLFGDTLRGLLERLA